MYFILRYLVRFKGKKIFVHIKIRSDPCINFFIQLNIKLLNYLNIYSIFNLSWRVSPLMKFFFGKNIMFFFCFFNNIVLFISFQEI